METFQPPARGKSCQNSQCDDTGTESTTVGDSSELEEPVRQRKIVRKPPAIPLRGVVQHYAWGKPSETSIVAHMATEQVRAKHGPMRAPPMSRGNRYAELWMGTHPNGHSSVIMPHHRGDRRPSIFRVPSSTNINAHKLMQIDEDACLSSDDEETQEWFLGDVIDKDPCFWLGRADAHRKNIPFLFKVLSVRQALSVQAHPNKTLAEELHRKSPGHYPDANHKPEICIPLGHFEALCGFRPAEEVRKHVNEVPELRKLTAIRDADIASATLKDMFTGLMNADSVQQAHQVVALIDRLKTVSEPSRDEKLILRLSQDYPTDVGVFAVYFLNYVVISEDMPRRFIFCAPDEPHAYLCGDAIECMAMSDNVVRVGLTPKFKDVETLLRMMTWRDDLLDELVNEGEQISEHVVKYDPPVDDFLVYEVDGPVPEGILLNRAAITACISGIFFVDFKASDDARAEDEESLAPFSWRGSKKIIKGHTFFSKAGTQLIVQSAEENSKMYIATY